MLAIRACMSTEIDITNPQEWNKFVDKDGYVHYRVYRTDEFGKQLTAEAGYPLYGDLSCVYFFNIPVIDKETLMLKPRIECEGVEAVLVFMPWL